MGRKGVGKLAPFGVCSHIEILSAGGAIVKEGDNEGYRTAHIILKKDGNYSAHFFHDAKNFPTHFLSLCYKALKT